MENEKKMYKDITYYGLSIVEFMAIYFLIFHTFNIINFKSEMEKSKDKIKLLVKSNYLLCKCLWYQGSVSSVGQKTHSNAYSFF